MLSQSLDECYENEAVEECEWIANILKVMNTAREKHERARNGSGQSEQLKNVKHYTTTSAEIRKQQEYCNTKFREVAEQYQKGGSVNHHSVSPARRQPGELYKQPAESLQGTEPLGVAVIRSNGSIFHRMIGNI